MMARPNITRWMISSDSSEKGTELMADSKADACYAPSYQLIRTTSNGPVAILWDIENCPVPSDVRPEDVAGNIRMALRVHPVINGGVMMFSAYGDFNAFPRRLREGCQRTGVKLVDVPNGRKDAADKAILVDMFLFAMDNPPPSSIMLISGDVDFAPALHILGQRGYTVILVIPSGVGVSSGLSNAGKFVWDWPSVARGKGFAPTMKAVMSSRGARSADFSGYFAGVTMNDNFEGQKEEEAMVSRGISQRYYNSRDFSIVTQSVSKYNSSSIMPYFPATSRSHSLPSGLNEVSCCSILSTDQNELTRVQPGDLNGLKHQLARLAILWDIENCPVPSDVRPEDVASNIRMALRVHPVINGGVMMFSAYGDFNAFPRRLREGCQRTGVKLVDVPNGRKDAADKAILVDMFLFAMDNPPPSLIMLISGDVDFAPALHILGQRGYTVILVIPSRVGVSSGLSNAGKFVWDWPSVARGKGFAPAMKAVMSSRGARTADVSGFDGVNMNDNFDGQKEEEAIVSRGISQRYYNSRDFSIVTQSVSKYNSSSIMPYFPATSRSHSLPSGLNEVSSCSILSTDQNELTWVQPGHLNGLKRQLARLLELSGGCLPLVRVPAEYLKVFGRPLYEAEYDVFKLINLFKKMEDLLCVKGKGLKKFVYLRNSKAYPSAPPLIRAKKENKKGKEVVEENPDLGSSEEYSNEEREVPIEHNGTNIAWKIEMGINYDVNLEQFKLELQEILVSYSCRIFLGYFEAFYLQRYKKTLDYAQFGIDKLEELFEKVSDVVELQEEPQSKKKFVVALGG